MFLHYRGHNNADRVRVAYPESTRRVPFAKKLKSPPYPSSRGHGHEAGFMSIRTALACVAGLDADQHKLDAGHWP